MGFQSGSLTLQQSSVSAELRQRGRSNIAIYPAFSGSPTFTYGFSDPLTVNGTSKGWSTPDYPWNGSGGLSVIGTSLIVAGASSPSSATGKANHVAQNASTNGGNHFRVRFQTMAPEVAFHFSGAQGSDISVLVDGAILKHNGNLPPVSGSSGSKWSVIVKFGDLPGASEVGTANVASGGSGYVIGDTITLAGGTSTTAAKLLVTRTSSGAVAEVLLIEKGSYSVVPSSPASQGSTSGSGTGATFTITTRTAYPLKMREIELMCGNTVQFGGVSVGSLYKIWPSPARGLRVMFVGDSYSDQSLIEYPGGQWWAQAARRLGFDDVWCNAIGGTGWLAKGAGNSYYNFRERIPSIAAQNPDVVIIPGSSNDAALTGLQDQITAGWRELRAKLPHALLIGMGPWTAPGAVTPQGNADANRLGAAASGSRVYYINSYDEGWCSTSGGVATWMIGDTVHPIQVGHDYLGMRAASAIASILRGQ